MKVADALRIAYGAALIARPQLLAGNSAGVGAARLQVVVRILGLRHLAQGALQTLVPTRQLRLAGAAADAAHAATDAGYGTLSGRWGPAAVDGAVAVVLGAANVALAWMPDTPARRRRRRRIRRPPAPAAAAQSARRHPAQGAA